MRAWIIWNCAGFVAFVLTKHGGFVKCAFSPIFYISFSHTLNGNAAVNCCTAAIAKNSGGPPSKIKCVKYV